MLTKVICSLLFAFICNPSFVFAEDTVSAAAPKTSSVVHGPSPINTIREVRKYTASEIAVAEDFKRILKEAKFEEGFVTFERKVSSATTSTIKVHQKVEHGKKRFIIEVQAPDSEWASAAYYGLQKMGFLFPHPRIQISPTEEQVRKTVGKSYTWEPRFKYRGFHFHTMHPSEFLQGFLMGQKQIARETIQWLARNGQNTAQVVLLRQDLKEITANLADLIDYSHEMGISFGVNAFFNFMQQKAYRLIGQNSKLSALGFIPGDKRPQIRKAIAELEKNLKFDFMSFDIGSSEFTPASYDKTISWINAADEELRKDGRSIFIKVHCSEGQRDKKYGNFNFIPQFANPTVGVLPHTVMYYSLTDESAPVYGNKNFKDMSEFLKAQAKVRPTWYYPETSYFIAMDIDLPLLLTDYLIARSNDMDSIEQWGAQGQLNFSTGQELGYWLNDWTVALLANSENRGNPYVALELLGESRKVWEPIVDFQNTYFKKKLLYEELSSANLSDELPVGIITHERTVFRELRKKPEVLKSRIALLKEAVANKPSLEGVKNQELKQMLEITFLRLDHAMYVRQALLAEAQKQRRAPAWQGDMTAAKDTRLRAAAIMKSVRANYERYPEAHLFERYENLTSYPFGYAWPASNLHFWEREERMIEANSYTPWFMNIYSIARILF